MQPGPEIIYHIKLLEYMRPICYFIRTYNDFGTPAPADLTSSIVTNSLYHLISSGYLLIQTICQSQEIDLKRNDFY